MSKTIKYAGYSGWQNDNEHQIGELLLKDKPLATIKWLRGVRINDEHETLMVYSGWLSLDDVIHRIGSFRQPLEDDIVYMQQDTLLADAVYEWQALSAAVQGQSIAQPIDQSILCTKEYWTAQFDAPMHIAEGYYTRNRYSRLYWWRENDLGYRGHWQFRAGGHTRIEHPIDAKHHYFDSLADLKTAFEATCHLIEIALR